MPYSINKYNGDLLTTVNDGQIDTTSSSLRLLGKGSTNYGELTAENFIHLLENFARTLPPANPQIGQLWYHLNANGNGNHVLKVCRDNTTSDWIAIDAVAKDLSGSTAGSGKPANPSSGALYWNGEQLEVFSGAAWRIVGPLAPYSTMPTDIYYDVITDTNDNSHEVIVMMAGGIPVTIFSKSSTTFNPKPGTATLKNTNLTKFPSLSGGININNDFTAGTVFDPQNITNHLLPGGDTAINLGSAQKRWGYVYSRTLQVDYLRTTDTLGNWAGDVDVRTILRSNMNNVPSLTNTYNLGSSGAQWNNVYAKTIHISEINVDGNLIDMTKFMRTDANNIPTTTTLNLGSALAPWNKTYSKDIHIDNIFLGTSGSSASSSVNVLNLARKDDDIVPTQTTTYNLGSASKKYNKVFSAQAEFDAITVTGTINGIDPDTISRIDQVEHHTRQKNFKSYELTGTSIVWDLDIAQTAYVDLTISKNISNPQNMMAGGRYLLNVQQDAAGNYSFNFPAFNSVYKFENDNIPIVNLNPNGVTIFEFYSDGQYMFCTNVKKYNI